MNLREMVRDPSAGIDAIGEALDRLPFDERKSQAHSLGRDDQRLLYKKAESAKPLALADFVPESVGPLTPVICHGRNTLPLPKKHKFFQKRFCRPSDGSARLFGYNEAASRWIVGPGYFVAHSSAENAVWEARGAIVIDYFMVPDGPVAAGWPEVVPNSKGLQRLVYYQTRDFMRRVSNTVFIGAAYKRETSLDHYFILCREG